MPVHSLVRCSQKGILAFLCFYTCVLPGCEQTSFQLIAPPSEGSLPCPPTLAERLTVTQVEVPKAIAWQRRGYDGFPSDERIALAIAPNGEAYIAWLANMGKAPDGSFLPDKGVHITPLDKNLKRRESDVAYATGLEVSGLVAHDDGFAMLVRDTNPGESIELNKDGNTVPFLVRFKNGQRLFAEPLAGIASADGVEMHTVYSPLLMGQLVWNGGTYAAYFTVKGGMGDVSEGLWRDLLVYRHLSDRLYSPWRPTSGCTNNGGIRLISDPGKVTLTTGAQANMPDMTGICVQQKPAMVKFTAIEKNAQVSGDDQEYGVPGFTGAKFGSLLKVNDGYLVFWLSLGPTNLRQGHDIRMAKLNREFKMVKEPVWLTRTPGIEEWNLHVAPYGDNRFLMIYNEIKISGSPAYSDGRVYLGEFQGTHLRLLSADGTFLSEDEVVQDVPITENDGPVLFPNGDIGWAWVNPKPDYTRIVPESMTSTLKALSIARVRVCR